MSERGKVRQVKGIKAEGKNIEGKEWSRKETLTVKGSGI
jgi:hypothetical protein